MSHMDFAHPYFGVFIMFITTMLSFAGTLFLARLVSRKLAKLDNEKLKLSIYECGPEVTKQPNKISAQFYLFAVLFIVFDIEIIFLFPWAVDFKPLGWFGFISIMVFLTILTIGFIYEWRKGALEWHSIK